MGKIRTLWILFRRHKYLVVTIIFILIIGIFDENCLMRRAAHHYEIATLKAEIERYTIQFEEDSRRLKEIENNPETIEKIAREKYLMKRPDEDVFIFEE